MEFLVEKQRKALNGEAAAAALVSKLSRTKRNQGCLIGIWWEHNQGCLIGIWWEHNQGCLIGIWWAGRGVFSGRAGAPVLLTQSFCTPLGITAPCSLLTARPHRHLQLLCLHVALVATVLAEVLPLAVGTLVWRARYKPSARSPGASTDGLSTKE